MNVSEVTRIKELADKAELESARSEGLIESIKKQWKKDYGTDDINEIRKIKANLKTELEKTEERKEVLYDKLMNSYDWDTLEEELA